VAGSVAAGFEPNALYARFEEHFLHANPSNDYTIPAIALLRGRKARRILADVLGSRRIEELPRSFFCLSCDLVARRPVVHRTGPLTDAVYASLAIPGIFPPLLRDDARVLVDGGILDNLPVETMDATREGPVIASDVTDPDGRWAAARRRPPGRIGRVVAGTDEPLPSLGETLFRTFTLGSIDTAEAAHRHADLVIVPPVAGIPLMDWKRLARLRDLGRRAAETALARHDELLRSWM
jgi:NTE family protein